MQTKRLAGCFAPLTACNQRNTYVPAKRTHSKPPQARLVDQPRASFGPVRIVPPVRAHPRDRGTGPRDTKGLARNNGRRSRSKVQDGEEVRKAAAVDANQSDIVTALRGAGCSVCLLHAVGKGCPDLLVAYHGRLVLMEIASAYGDQRRF